MKFIVSVKEVNYGGVSVEANSVEEARELAEQEYFNGNVFWKDTDLEYPSVRLEKERGDAR